MSADIQLPSLALALALARGSFRAFLVTLLLASPAWGERAVGDPSNLAELRDQALVAVNADRDAHGLALLKVAGDLEEAAQAHARDMLARNYFAHASPEGKTAQDRYLEHGGKSWRVVAENIAKCGGCTAPIGQERIEALERGWMNSPEHRKNILAKGLDQFGYGIITGQDAQLYAVQVFSGPGTPVGLKAGEEARPVSPDKAREVALAQINGLRAEKNIALLEASPALNAVGEALLPGVDAPFEIATQGLGGAMPVETQAEWAALAAISAGCGGCGAEMTDADIRWFKDRWLRSQENGATLLDETMTHLGFASVADGDGRKLAVAVLGRRR